MARTQAPTVNTGGEMGQILDHLMCAGDNRIRMQDARDALALHTMVLADLNATHMAYEIERLRGDALELVLLSIRNNVDGALRAHKRSEENA